MAVPKIDGYIHVSYLQYLLSSSYDNRAGMPYISTDELLSFSRGYSVTFGETIGPPTYQSVGDETSRPVRYG